MVRLLHTQGNGKFEEIRTYMPKIEKIIDNFNQLEPLFESLNRLSEIISLLTDPLGSEG